MFFFLQSEFEHPQNDLMYMFLQQNEAGFLNKLN